MAETATYKAIAAGHERAFRMSRASHIADLMWEAVVSRDKNLPKFGETHQSLATYNQWGYVEEDPINLEFAQAQKKALTAEVHEQTLSMSQHEMDAMTMLVPKLVGALVLDKRFITKVYEADFQSVFKVALDWFAHPDAIDQTHIRIGFGGEEKIGSRVPAYVTAGVETLQRVREVQTVHGNWAIHNSLHNRLPDAERAQLDKVVVFKIRNAVGNLWKDDNTPYSDDDYLSEILNPRLVTPAAMRDILTQTWNNFTLQPGGLRQVMEAYHVTDKLPKLVIFNGAHAAIEIDQMDREKVLAMRNETQNLIRGYTAQFHPDFVDSLVFQNDTDWEQHTDSTRLVMHYLLDLINASNGERAKVSEKLHQFGQHHQRDQHARVMGATPSEVYAMLHRDFFDDPFMAEAGERLYPTNVMEGLTPPRNVIWRQGQPEIAFGAIRKLVSQEATMSGFIRWMEYRAAALENNYGDMALEIGTRALQLYQEYQAKSDKPREFSTFLLQAMTPSKKEQKPADSDTVQISEMARTVFRTFVTSERFAHAGLDQLPFWGYFAEKMNTPILFTRPGETVSDDPDIRAQQLTYEAEQLRGFIDHMKFHADLMDDHQSRMNAALQENDQARAESESTRPEAFLGLRTNRVETITAVGELPVYYVTDSDAITYPNGELPSLDSYENHVHEASTRLKRIKGTIGYIGGKLSEVRHSHDPQPATISISRLVEWIDEMETGGASREEIDTVIENAFRGTDITEEDYKTTTEIVMKELSSKKAQTEIAQNDYYALLRDIDPRIAELEVQREELLATMQGMKNGEKAAFRDTILAEHDEHLRTARLIAEQEYIALLQATFFPRHGTIYSSEQVAMTV